MVVEVGRRPFTGQGRRRREHGELHRAVQRAGVVAVAAVDATETAVVAEPLNHGGASAGDRGRRQAGPPWAQN